MDKIPEYVQVLNRVADPDDDLKEHLIKSYNLDGVMIDQEMFKMNPNAKDRVICITARRPKVVMAGAEEFRGKDKNMGNWVYCGNLYYVRKLDDKYEFAQYLKYNTKTRKTEGLWNEAENK